MKYRFNIMICLFAYCCNAHAQALSPVNEDTIYLNLKDAQQRLLEKNLTLLLNYYNIDIAKANYLQSKLLYNPNFSYWQELYNPSKRDFFNYSDEHGGQIQQLFTLAGRHKATWKLAEVGVKLAQYQVADILRNLKYELVTDMSDLYNNQSLAAMYVSEEGKIKYLLGSTQTLYKAGNASGNDVIRLQAQLQDIIAQEITCRQAISADEQDLGILLVYPGNTYFVVHTLEIEVKDIPPYTAILDSAMKNRPDLELASAGVEYSQQNLKLQRVTGVPDLTLAANFESANDYAPNFWGVQASVDLPLWNHNQWNITAAKEQKTQAELNDSLALYNVMNQVTAAYTNLYRINNRYSKIDPQYEQDLDEMMDNAVKNYDKRYISLLDLLSQISTFIDGKTNLLNMKVQYFNAIYSVNLNSGTDIIK